CDRVAERAIEPGKERLRRCRLTVWIRQLGDALRRVSVSLKPGWGIAHHGFTDFHRIAHVEYPRRVGKSLRHDVSVKSAPTAQLQDVAAACMHGERPAKTAHGGDDLKTRRRRR